MAQSSTSKALVEALGCFSLAMLPEVRMILEFFWRSELRAVSLFWVVKQHIFFIIAGLLAVVLILFYGSWCCDKALTMVLMCPCRPHRLWEMKTILSIDKIVKKAEIIDSLSFCFLFPHYRSRKQQLMILSLVSLSMPRACQLPSKFYSLHCNIYELPPSLNWWCNRKNPCQLWLRKIIPSEQ